MKYKTTKHLCLIQKKENLRIIKYTRENRNNVPNFNIILSLYHYDKDKLTFKKIQ